MSRCNLRRGKLTRTWCNGKWWGQKRIIGDIWALCGTCFALGRLELAVLYRGWPGSGLGPYRAALPLFGYLATRNQYLYDHRHLPDGLSDSEHPEPRRESHPPETR